VNYKSGKVKLFSTFFRKANRSLTIRDQNVLYSKNVKRLDPVEVHIQLETKRLLDENAVLKSWVRSNENPTCVVCGKPIPHASIQRLLRAFLWDSKECFVKKPKKVIALEKFFDSDILDILKNTTRKFQNISMQAEYLNVSMPYIYNLIHKYWGQDHTKFFSEFAIGKRKLTYLNKLKNRKRLQYPPTD